MTGTSSTSRQILLDVSRLIWRLWRGGLPTGIDRVCLEYVAHFARRAQAVVQFRGRIVVFDRTSSDRLFAFMLSERRLSRRRLLSIGARAIPAAAREVPRHGAIYLNVGHTSLQETALPAWIAKHGLRAIYLIHDLIPITHPEFCRAGEALKHELRVRNALSSAAGIIGNSRATLDDLIAFASERRLRMPPVLCAWISGWKHTKTLEPRALEKPHFITVGTIEARKNHILLLRVWERLIEAMGEDAPILLVVGQRGWEAEATIAALDLFASPGGKVRELNRCEDDEVQDLVAGAKALLMPSWVEGFGLPIIEALQVGTPVIASDLPVYHELVGDIPTYVAPNDESAWETAIRAFLIDGPESRRQRHAMKGYQPPDWPSHFAKVEGWLNQLSD